LEKRLLVKTTLLLASLRLGLWIIPFQILRRAAERSIRRSHGKNGVEAIRNIISLLARANGYVPRAAGLPQALAAQVLLRQEGFRPKLQIGVFKTDGGKLQIHARVECCGKTVIGETPRQVFSMMNE